MYEPSEMEPRYPSPEPQNGKADRLALLWRERRFLWRVAWKTAIIASVVAICLPNHYDGITKIVPGENQSGGAMGGLRKLAGGSPGGSSGGWGPSRLPGLKSPRRTPFEYMHKRTLQHPLHSVCDL